MFRVGAAILLLASLAAAQTGPEPASPARTGEPLLVLLRDPAGQAVAGATATLHAHPVGQLAVLRGFAAAAAGVAAALPDVARLTGTSDATGLLRLQPERDVQAANGLVASGWVATASGLGALLLDLQPGRAQRIEMQPMAALTTATGSEELRVFARAVLPSGLTVDLAPPPATTVRLPAGTYELWVHSADGWIWQRRLLTPGERCVLSFLGPTLRLEREAATPWPPRVELLHPAGRPDVLLFSGSAPATARAARTASIVLIGEAARAPMVAMFGTEVSGPRGLADVPDGQVLRWPPREQRAAPLGLGLSAHFDVVTGTPRMALFSVQRQPDGSWRVLGASRVHTPAAMSSAGEWFELPTPPSGDVWLVWAVAGHAPQAKPWIGAATDFPFRLQRGVPLAVQARDESGQPVENLLVEYAPADMDPAAVEGRSDARGTARLGPVLAPGTLRVVDPRFANQEIPLALVPADGVAVTVTAGSVLRGTAKWSDGSVAHGVLVALRDPNGTLRPAQRTTSSNPDGTFTFGGLPADRPLVLFAQAQRNGRTWSGKLVGLRAGTDGAVELVLRDEDPQLLPPSAK